MAVGVLTAAPQFTKQIYDDVTEKMFGHAAPMRDDDAHGGGVPKHLLGDVVVDPCGTTTRRRG